MEKGITNATIEEREKYFAIRFNGKFGSEFVYHSGFTHTDKPFKSKCLTCGFVQDRNAQCLRRDKVIKCQQCEEHRKELKGMIKNNKTALYYKKVEVQRKAKSLRQETLLGICATCGNVFEKKTKATTVCSKECKNKRDNRNKENKRRKLYAESKDISLEKLISKDNNTCYICGEQCDKGDYTITKEGYYVVGNNYPSIEHVIPISKGGEHSWENIKLAHHYCNTIKRDNGWIVKNGQGELLL